MCVDNAGLLQYAVRTPFGHVSATLTLPAMPRCAPLVAVSHTADQPLRPAPLAMAVLRVSVFAVLISVLGVASWSEASENTFSALAGVRPNIDSK